MSPLDNSLPLLCCAIRCPRDSVHGLLLHGLDGKTPKPLHPYRQPAELLGTAVCPVHIFDLDRDLINVGAKSAQGKSVRAFNHLLGECGLSFFATAELASKYRRRFPASLEGAPLLVPIEKTAVRRDLEQWFDAKDIRPRIVGEFEDTALMKVFGQDGIGLFPAPTVIEEEVCRQYKVRVIGRTDDVRERYYAISVERRLKHPAVLAICEAARDKMFA